MLIDMNKKYTSDGKPIRILCTDRNDGRCPVVGITNEGAIITFSGDGKNPAWPAYNLIEQWEPQPGEWCLFWDNDEKQHYVVLYRFTGMTDCGRFKSDDCISWKYCAKFDGTLPEHLKEDVK
jgi:hypothetical protein